MSIPINLSSLIDGVKLEVIIHEVVFDETLNIIWRVKTETDINSVNQCVSTEEKSLAEHQLFHYNERIPLSNCIRNACFKLFFMSVLIAN